MVGACSEGDRKQFCFVQAEYYGMKYMVDLRTLEVNIKPSVVMKTHEPKKFIGPTKAMDFTMIKSMKIRLI